MRLKLLGLLVVIFGLLLVLDEIGMAFQFFFEWPYPPFPPSGWLLGDLSAWHIEPYHHWMLGAPLILGGFYLCRYR